MKVTSRYQPVDDAQSRTRGDELIDWLRDYGSRRINSRLIDERRTIPPYVVLDFGNQGILGMQVEPRFGGLGLRNRDLARVLEQAAAIDLAVGSFVLVCLFPGIRPIAAFASEALREELLPGLAAGRVLAGYGQTEPGAGTHFPAMTTEARAIAPGRWRLSGDKIWIGNATWAGLLTVMGHDVDASGKRKGLSAFVVRTNQPGVRLGRELLSMGMRGVVQSEVGFRDVELDEGALLGQRGLGVEVGVDSMSFSRFAIAATCIGAMKRCVQLAARFAARRSIATGKLLEHPVARVALGESLAEIAACESLLYRVADDLDAGRAVAPERFAACKVAASEFACSVADRAMQILGSRGYDEENLAAQFLRDARVTRIFEGTSEALLAYLGAAVLNPRSDVYAHLQEDLGANAIVERLREAADALRTRRAAGGEPLARAWQCALAGQAAVCALIAASLERDAADAPSEERERFAAWAGVRLDATLDHAVRGPGGEALLLAIPVEKAIAGLVATIGEPEQTLPGERLGLDPLLRRQPPDASGTD